MKFNMLSSLLVSLFLVSCGANNHAGTASQNNVEGSKYSVSSNANNSVENFYHIFITNNNDSNIKTYLQFAAPTPSSPYIQFSCGTIDQTDPKNPQMRENGSEILYPSPTYTAASNQNLETISFEGMIFSFNPNGSPCPQLTTPTSLLSTEGGVCGSLITRILNQKLCVYP